MTVLSTSETIPVPPWMPATRAMLPVCSTASVVAPGNKDFEVETGVYVDIVSAVAHCSGTARFRRVLDRLITFVSHCAEHTHGYTYLAWTASIFSIM